MREERTIFNRGRNRRPAAILVAWLVFSVLHSSVGFADPIECDSNDERILMCLVAADESFDDEIRRLMESGFTNNLIYRIGLHRQGDALPVGLGLVSFAEVFRLYTDIYYVSREGEEGYVAASDWEQAIAALSQFSVDFGDIDSLGPGEYYVSVLLEVNPLSVEEITEARNWIARTRGGYRLFGEGDRTFGTFISLFVNAESSSAEATRMIRSSLFELIP